MLKPLNSGKPCKRIRVSSESNPRLLKRQAVDKCNAGYKFPAIDLTKDNYTPNFNFQGMQSFGTIDLTIDSSSPISNKYEYDFASPKHSKINLTSNYGLMNKGLPSNKSDVYNFMSDNPDVNDMNYYLKNAENLSFESEIISLSSDSRQHVPKNDGAFESIYKDKENAIDTNYYWNPEIFDQLHRQHTFNYVPNIPSTDEMRRDISEFIREFRKNKSPLQISIDDKDENQTSDLYDESTENLEKLENTKSFNFTSPKGAWNKVFRKYSPATEIFHSPIKPIEACIKPSVSKDELIHAQVWIVGMSEQFYYDNSLTLIYKYHDDPFALNEALIFNSRNIHTDDIMKTFVDLVILGSGAFGDVYRATKAGTDDYIAIKFLKKIPSEWFYEHTHALLEYIRERNSLIKARNSPFVVQFLTSLKFPGISGLFLFFEWCLCDLRKYVKLVEYKENVKILTSSLWDGKRGGLEELLRSTYSAFSEDLFSVTLIYIFEVFCAIDFLAKCNIVHQDLKPDNFMIATNLHLKIADFGLAYNTRFITSQSQIHLVDANEINLMQSSNYKAVWGGTASYEDMELCYRALRREDMASAKDIINNLDRIKIDLPTVDKEADPDFMSDLWACGIIATEMLFGGAHIFKPENISQSIKLEMTVTWSFRQSVLAITYIRHTYVRYIEKGFLNYGGRDYVDLMKFLASIFKPRQERAMGFVKEKEVYRYKNKIKLKYIDIKKVEEIPMFQKIKLTSNNVFLYTLPKGLQALLSKPFTPKYETLGHLLASIPKSEKHDFINLKPGIQSNYF